MAHPEPVVKHSRRSGNGKSAGISGLDVVVPSAVSGEPLGPGVGDLSCSMAVRAHYLSV